MHAQVKVNFLTALADSTDVFSMGYVVGGAGTIGAKPLVIRAAGPARRKKDRTRGQRGGREGFA